jgi:curved DNA-binding protein CbpA
LRNYYDLLSVARDAPADEIKTAFRREIARYHPDKVQHLGVEFQEMAATMAADLTEAYRILMDPALRAKYDGDLGTRSPGQGAAAPPPRPAAGPPPPSPPPHPPSPHRSAGLDFVRRASLSKVREAIDATLGSAEPLQVPGFDLAVVTKPKKGLFRRAQESVCLVVKFVPFVDAAAINGAWLPAAKVRVPDVDGCGLLLLGQGLAPVDDLAAAVSELRRRSRGSGPLVIPVDVRDWKALFPPETPGPVRSLIQRLKEVQR